MENEFNKVETNNQSADNGFVQSETKQYVQYGYDNNQPQKKGGNGIAIAGMVLGILSLVTCCITALSLLLAVIGMILSIVAIVKKTPGKGMAIAGIICSAISLVVGIVAIIFVVSTGMAGLSSMDYQEIQNALENMQ